MKGDKEDSNARLRYHLDGASPHVVRERLLDEYLEDKRM